MTPAGTMMKLWFWPWEAAQMGARVVETMVATQTVLAARLPMISAAMANPLAADHRELSLMVSEKIDAFGRSGRSVSKAGAAVQKAAQANARDLGRLGGGALLPTDWLTLFERNMAMATTLMTLPMDALAPIHKGVTSNARRLRRS
jgi:hypothetical protein